MKNIAMLVLILIFFSGCSTRTETVAPKLHTIDAKTKELKPCKTTYTISADGNVTLSLEEGRCIIMKLNRCIRNNEKLMVANTALNEQILLLNSIGGE